MSGENKELEEVKEELKKENVQEEQVKLENKVEKEDVVKGKEKSEKKVSKKKNSILKKILLNKTTVGILFVAIVVVAALIYIRFFAYKNEATLSNKMVLSTITKSSELTTAKLNYQGFAKYDDKGIPVLTKADFSMVYEATARIGIDLKQVKTRVVDPKKDKKGIVWVTLPKATVQEVKIKPDSIEYFNEKVALFNFDDKEDSDKAQSMAEQEAKKQAENMGILEYADMNARDLIKGILAEVVPDNYEIKFE